jgi:hypothetical protein
MPEPLLRSLARVESRVSVIAAETDLDGAVRMAVADLFRGPSSGPLPAQRVVVGPVTYGETGLGSEFAPLLKRYLSEYLIRVRGLEVVVPRQREVAAVARAAQTRGITARKTPSLGSAATQASIDQADAGLEITYSFFGEEEVRVSLALKEAGTDILLGAASASIDRRTLPPGISLAPALTAPHPLPRPAANAGIRLELTSHLGDGQTYTEGESISYFVNLDRDAYLLLIYEDAGGNLIRILPNKYSGKGFYRKGSTVEIPGENDGFEFTITPPFGVERVWAFAASVPFPHLPGTELENGLLLLREDMNTLLRRVRTAAGGNGYGEALTTVTTIPRKRSVALSH